MRKFILKMDIPLLITFLLYMILGLIMVYSTSNITAIVRYGVAPSYFFVRQAIFMVVALLIGIFIILRLPTKAYNTLAYPALIIIVASLVLLFAHGKITNSAVSWYDLKFFKIQPSEFAKSILIIFSAVYYNGLTKRNVKNLYAYFIPLVASLIVVGLVLLQPDLGSAFIIGVISLMMFLSLPIVEKNKKTIFKIFGIGILLVLIVFLAMKDQILSTIHSSRFNYQNPCSRYTEETGYQVCNGFIAINNGGLFGVGLNHSTQKYLYLPEAHTDFIFPIIVEELGLVVGIIIIFGYGFILYRILKISKEADNLRCSLLAYGAFWYLGLHILINLLGILALIPLTGVPLPLLSYGGSFTVNAILILFLMERINIENKDNKTKREIKAL